MKRHDRQSGKAQPWPRFHETRNCWAEPPAGGLPGEAEVHVWRALLDLPTLLLARLAVTLSRDESARASRFVFQADRLRFIAAHGLLRSILGRYLSLAPGRLRFGANRYGKPFLRRETGGDRLHFNMSYSGGYALFALAAGRRIGVDIERIRPGRADMRLVRHLFAPEEIRALSALPPRSRETAWFDCWTRKEAYVKARGRGLSLPLDSFAVSLDTDEPRITIRDDARATTRWTLRPVHPYPQCAAALVVEGDGPRMSFFQWTDP